MFESLTQYINTLDKDNIGDFLEDTVDENSITPGHAIYTENVNKFIKEVNKFMIDDKELDLVNYRSILNTKFDGTQIHYFDLDVNNLDGQIICALIVGIVRAQRFGCDRQLYECLKNGTMTKWLKRLEELDSSMEK